MDRSSIGRNTWGSARGFTFLGGYRGFLCSLSYTIPCPTFTCLCSGVSGAGVGALEEGQKLDI